MAYIIFISLAIIFFTISVLHFFRKGILLHPSYIFSPKYVRTQVTEKQKKPYFLQTGICSLLLALIFVFLAIESYLHIRTMVLDICRNVLILDLIVYSVIISIKEL